MAKRFFAAFCLVLLGFGFSVPSASALLADVSGTRYDSAYTYLIDRGAVQGYQDGLGRPFGQLNRVEALKVLLELRPGLKGRVEWYRRHLSSLSLFVDTRQTEWYAPYLEAAFEEGIITGYPDRTFKPARPLTTEEAVTLLLRAYGQAPAPAQGAEWYTPALSAAINRNLIYGDEALYLGEPITRGQFFDMVYRMETITQKNIARFVDTVPPSRSVSIVRRQYVPARASSGGGNAPQYASQKNFSISIPKLGIQDLTVSHPRDALTSNGLLEVLKDGVGHLFSYPGKGGKIMIYGHSSGYAWDVSKFTKIFRRVNELSAGDRVYVTYDGKLFEYEVTKQQRIAPNDVRPFSGRGEELILYTCWPLDSNKERLIVHAVPVTNLAQR